MVKRKLLYITAVQEHQSATFIAEATQAVISILKRDFDVSLAVVGAVSTDELNALRAHLSITRVTGGFDHEPTDSAIEEPLKSLYKCWNVTPLVSGRLKSAIQRRAADFESVVIDNLLAIPYLPLGVQGKTVFFAHKVASDSRDVSQGMLGGRRVARLRPYEREAMLRCDRVFSTTDTASSLLELGLPLGKLVDEATRPSAARPSAIVSGFSSTRMRIGYSGYLGDDQNTASLRWFLENVWGAIREAVPGLEFHVIGGGVSEEVASFIVAQSDVILHRDNNDRKVTELGIRVMVEPLLHELHVEAKLVNAMVRAVPLAATREAVTRAGLNLMDAVSVADSPAHMVLNLRRILSEATLWEALSARSEQIGTRLLAYHEVAHSMRRLLIQV